MSDAKPTWVKDLQADSKSTNNSIKDLQSDFIGVKNSIKNLQADSKNTKIVIKDLQKQILSNCSKLDSVTKNQQLVTKSIKEINLKLEKMPTKIKQDLLPQLVREVRNFAKSDLQNR